MLAQGVGEFSLGKVKRENANRLDGLALSPTISLRSRAVGMHPHGLEALSGIGDERATQINSGSSPRA